MSFQIIPPIARAPQISLTSLVSPLPSLLSLFSLLSLSSLFLLFTGCAPKIYVIDRQTVFEEEAAGQWPQFDQEILSKSKATGPTPFPKTPVNARKQRLYNVLNGELLSN